MRDRDAYTHPAAKKSGIGLTWRNSSGRRPQTAQTVVRDQRIAQLREALVKRPCMTAPSVVKMFGVKLPTAERYLALAREPPTA